MYYEMLQNMVGSGMTKYAGMEKQALTLQQLTQMYMRAQAKGPQAAARFEQLLAKRNAAIPKIRDSRKALEKKLYPSSKAAWNARGFGLIDDTTHDAIRRTWKSSNDRLITRGKYMLPDLLSMPVRDRVQQYGFKYAQAPAINARNLNRLLADDVSSIGDKVNRRTFERQMRRFMGPPSKEIELVL